MKALALALVLFLSSCATTPMNPKKKIKVEKDFFGDTYSQNEKKISLRSLEKELLKNESTKGNIKFVKRAFYPSMILAGIGGWYLGKFTSNTDKKENLYISLGTVIPAFYLGFLSDKKMKEAVETHNKGISFLPVLGPKTAGGNLHLSF